MKISFEEACKLCSHIVSSRTDPADVPGAVARAQEELLKVGWSIKALADESTLRQRKNLFSRYCCKIVLGTEWPF